MPKRYSVMDMQVDRPTVKPTKWVVESRARDQKRFHGSILEHRTHLTAISEAVEHSWKVLKFGLEKKNRK